MNERMLMFDGTVDVEPLFPPPPHDPRERETALVVQGWEARLLTGRMFEYFASRGLWHLQLWHPLARVSVLTPSRLTRGLYEAFPVANWKAQAASYDALVTLLAGVTAVPFLPRHELERLEQGLVAGVVRGALAGARERFSIS